MKKEKDKNKLFVFRRYKKKQGERNVRHPKLIVDIESDSYGYMGLTEHNKKGKHHSNMPLKDNPKKGDSRKAYLRKKIEYDKQEKFGHILDDYNLSQKDKEYIIKYVEKHKKR